MSDTEPTETPPTAPPRSGLPARLLAELAAMIRFYSRLPLPPLSPADDPAAPPPFATAIRMLPWASLLIAIPAALVVAVLGETGLPDLAVAALAVATLAWVTGAFHEDGFADVADGFAGGATPARRLEIMKDSRIGAFGGVALVAQFVLRTSLIAEAIDRFDPAGAGLVLVAVAALARVAPLALMSALAPARPDGLARAAGRPEPQAFAIAVAGALALVLFALPPLAGAAATLAALALVALTVLLLGRMARAKIGGLTGDVVGTGTIAAEIAALIGLLA